MMNFIFFLATIISFSQAKANEYESGNPTFYQNYYPYWGINHFKLLKIGSEEEVQLLIDQSSGSGFKSRWNYESGLFHIKMKMPHQKTGGIIPNFYLISEMNSTRDELDFEFMGTKGLLQTNIFIEGVGGREQRFQLPFDPSMDFHTYSILWNRHQIVFFVDDIPIRVYRNNTGRGVKYPTKPMRMEGTLWNSSWAGQVDWNLGPFSVMYRDFDNITACSSGPSGQLSSAAAAVVDGREDCFSSKFFWNDVHHSDLSSEQKKKLEKTRKSWLVSDYCKSKKTSHLYPECSIHQDQ